MKTKRTLIQIWLLCVALALNATSLFAQTYNILHNFGGIYRDARIVFLTARDTGQMLLNVELRPLPFRAPAPSQPFSSA
jgi:hypothetical protein